MRNKILNNVTLKTVLIIAVSLFLGYLFYSNGLMLGIALWVAIPLAIIFSFKNYYRTDNKLKAKLLIIGTTLAGFIYAIMQLYAYVVFSNLYLSLENIKTNHNEPKFISMYNNLLHDKKRTLTDRISITNELASSVYRSSGTKLEVVNKSGSISTYIPTVKDINYRKNITYLKEENSKMVKYKKYGSILYTVVLFISIIIGVVLMRRQRYIRHNIESTTLISS